MHFSKPDIKPYLFILLLAFPAHLTAQGRITVKEYILKYKDISVEKMKEYGIPASITLAQGILESGNGNSRLARKANNHFGIKCHGWRGRKFYQDDDAKNECFRKYRNPEESYRDHSLFLTNRSRYAALFTLNIRDYKGWAHGLKKAGYATNPRYPQLLIRIIEEHQLYLLDRGQDIAFTNNSINGKKPSEVVLPVAKHELHPSTVVKEIGPNERKIYENNGVKFIYARKGDDFEKIADDFNIYTWQVYKYNELEKDDKLLKDQVIYLEKKRNRAEKKYHVVQEGETMYYISQLYAVKLKKLYRKNNMEENMEPLTGQKLRLR